MIKISIFRRSILLCFFLSFIILAASFGFSFSPMTVSIAPSGSGAVITYRVTNESDQQTAVSIKVATRVIDAKGNETNEPADKLFLVFPARVVLKPNSAQNVKIQYRGPSTITSEAAYRVIAEQLPVDFTKSASSGVSILLTYVAALYVTPKNVTPKLVVGAAVGIQGEKGPGLEVTLKNEGSKHALITNPVLKLNQGAANIEFSGDVVSAIDGQNLLALSERTFFVPWEAAVIGATYEGNFDAEIE